MKKLLSMLCALALTLSLIPGALAAEPVEFTAGGWYETIRAELTNVTDEQVTAVSYTPEGEAPIALTGEDFAYLVRDMEGGVRIDIPGVKPGTYTLTVTLAGDKNYIAEGIEVAAYDRSGFAHKVHTVDGEGNVTGIQDYTEGVGAYNDDGTLKENAIVLYVTEENKESVEMTVGSTTVTGIGKILNSGQASKNKVSKVLLEASRAGKPVVIRIMGAVTQPQGVSERKESTDADKENGNNGGMCFMAYAKNITVEGIGTDAAIDGWGLSFTGDAADANNDAYGKNFEVRNLSFRNVPEDCVEITGNGNQDGSIKEPVSHAWVHNCAFHVPHIENPAAVDKAQGDGAMDFKFGRYMTMSYNYFEGYHKTSLIGGKDTNEQYHITWHHNWWKNVESRAPLCRKADVHIYNNLFDGQTSYCMSLRANCFIFSEYNTFANDCKDPMRNEGSGGVCKSFGDDFSGMKSGARKEATVVADRSETVASSCKYANFDTNEAMSYIPSGDYALQTDTAKAVEDIQANSGVMKEGGLTVTGAAEVLRSGNLGEESDGLTWVYAADDTLTVTGAVPEDEKILVGCYDGEGCLTEVALITKDALKARLAEGVERIKLFWLDAQTQPKCQVVNAWGE